MIWRIRFFWWAILHRHNMWLYKHGTIVCIGCGSIFKP